MTICEYCGRVHQVTQPDPRFCSVLCRVQHEHHPAFYAPQELADAQRSHAEFLGSYHVTLAKAATLLLKNTEGLGPEQQVPALRNWLAMIGNDESFLVGVNEVFDLSSPASPAT